MVLMVAVVAVVMAVVVVAVVVVMAVAVRRVVDGGDRGAAKPFIIEAFERGCHVVLRGRRGTT